jgi:hypothetical protein
MLRTNGALKCYSNFGKEKVIIDQLFLYHFDVEAQCIKEHVELSDTNNFCAFVYSQIAL